MDKLNLPALATQVRTALMAHRLLGYRCRRCQLIFGHDDFGHFLRALDAPRVFHCTETGMWLGFSVLEWDNSHIGKIVVRVDGDTIKWIDTSTVLVREA